MSSPEMELGWREEGREESMGHQRANMHIPIQYPIRAINLLSMFTHPLALHS